MRFILGLTILFAVFAVSSLWHGQEQKALLIQRELLQAENEREAKASLAGSFDGAVAPRQNEPGWGDVIVGRPSGAERIQPAPQINYAQPTTAASEPQNWGTMEAGSPPPPPADFELTIQSGQVLGSIVSTHYGRVSPDLEQRLAKYNGLSSPDKLRVGQKLKLPTEQTLLDLDL